MFHRRNLFLGLIPLLTLALGSVSGSPLAQEEACSNPKTALVHSDTLAPAFGFAGSRRVAVAPGFSRTLLLAKVIDGQSIEGLRLITVCDEFPGSPSPGNPRSLSLPLSLKLHPSRTGAQPVVVAIPFPQGLQQDTALQIGGNAVAAKRLASWGDGSVRSVLVSFQHSFTSLSPVSVVVSRGSESVDWEAVGDSTVKASLPARWLSGSGIRAVTSPLGESPGFALFDEAYRNFSRTAVNDVAASVTEENRIDFESKFEPWLLDRPGTLWGLYLRTGSVTWLERAQEATDAYASQVAADGFFELKPRNDRGLGDLKYSATQGLLASYLLTGDEAMRNKILEIAAVWHQHWTPEYKHKLEGSTFWTERHQSLALHATLSAWEVTGNSVFADRARAIVDTTLAMTEVPAAGVAPIGAPLHSFRSHEGWGSNDLLSSPWMLALLAEAMSRYDRLLGDDRISDWLAGVGDYLLNYGTYIQGPEMKNWAGTTAPYYLASAAFSEKYNGGWDDHNHACSVATLAYRAALAASRLGRDYARVLELAGRLKKTCDASIQHWWRPDANKFGKAVWRLAPARMYNWRFGSTLDLPYIAQQLQ